MTAFYVFAVTDAVPKTAGRGLGGPLVLRPIAGVYVALERRADVPPVSWHTEAASSNCRAAGQQGAGDTAGPLRHAADVGRHRGGPRGSPGKSSPTRSTSFAAGAK